MSLTEFRTLCAELKFVPDEAEEIVKHWPSAISIAPLLVTALKALNIADEVLTKQADTVLQSAHELTACLKDIRSIRNESAVSDTNISDPSLLDKSNETPINDSGLFLFPENSPESKRLVRPTQPQPRTEYGLAAKTSGIKDAEKSFDMCYDELQSVKVRRRHSRKKSGAIIGRKPTMGLGTCARANKFDAFISRLAPDVTVGAVKEFCECILSEECEVEKLATKFSTYSSFKITCSRWEKEKIMNADSWESGIFLRPFYKDYYQARRVCRI